MSARVRARCYDFPIEGALDVRTTALIVIDMQRDFCEPDGFYALAGCDVAPLRAVVPPIRALLSVCRKAGILVLHTRQGYRPDLADLARFKALRNLRNGVHVGVRGAGGRLFVRGEPGWEHIPELRPIDGEPVIDKTANSAFCGTDLEIVLRRYGITHLMIAGVTTEICVHSTIRAADDLGFECLLLEDCCASGDPQMHAASVRMMTVEGGAFGCVAGLPNVIDALGVEP